MFQQTIIQIIVIQIKFKIQIKKHLDDSISKNKELILMFQEIEKLMKS